MARRKIRIDAAHTQAATATRVETEYRTSTQGETARTDCSAPHGLEQRVRFELESRHAFASLVVRRIPGGVCLQGVLDVGDDLPDVDALARRIAGVERVLNQVVMVHRDRPVNRLEAFLQ